MGLELGMPIAERVLTHGPKKRKRIIVRLGMPRRAELMVWMCPFQISGIGRSRVERALGLDAVQALQLAFAAIRFQLARLRVVATWAGGEEGDPGFPETVPYAFGRAFAARISRLIAREEKLFVREVRRKRKARRQRTNRTKTGRKRPPVRGHGDRHGSAERGDPYDFRYPAGLITVERKLPPH
jgi:hypothetical protein